MRKALLFLAILIITHGLQAQSLSAQPFVRASGYGSVTVKPDPLKLTVGVTTQATTAQKASEENAAQMEKVLSKLHQIVGSTGDIKTVTYSVTPVYKYNSADGTSTLIGYKATNMVEITTSDLSLGGPLADAATAAGANSIQGLRFALKDSDPARNEALRQATRRAKEHAEAMASGLGMRVGQVVSAEESSAVKSIVSSDNRDNKTAGSTPVETGMIEVSASVIVEAVLVS
jgi:uncharacterized protein